MKKKPFKRCTICAAIVILFFAIVPILGHTKLSIATSMQYIKDALTRNSNNNNQEQYSDMRNLFYFSKKIEIIKKDKIKYITYMVSPLDCYSVNRYLIEQALVSIKITHPYWEKNQKREPYV